MELRLQNKILFSIGLFVLLFLLNSFTNLSFDPNNWSESERLLMGVGWVGGTILWAAYLEDIKKK
jgi:hypothetical protein